MSRSDMRPACPPSDGPTSAPQSDAEGTTPGTGVATEDPPVTLRGTLSHLGPGVILAGAIVGSGELFATTGTGAQAGVGLLWLIVVGCVVKVFVQVELGRAAVVTGETTLSLLNRVPGPRLRFRVRSETPRPLNWVVLMWAAMMLTQLGQMGGLAGGVGQALALAAPLTGDYAALFDRPPDLDGSYLTPPPPPPPTGFTVDDKLWAAGAAALTAVLLWGGRYRFLQAISAVLVAAFTVLTVGNAAALQVSAQFSIPAGDLAAALNPFNALPKGDGATFLALAAFGLIGVGATELVAYPYWCLEKGYARFAGERPTDDGPGRTAWTARARGWMRVMRWDAFAALAVYTVGTVAFYLTGAAVLHRRGLAPDSSDLIPTLGEAYVPAFGPAAWGLFLAGAVAVLFSTLLIATAANARMFADGARLAGLLPGDEPTYRGAVRGLSVGLPAVSAAAFAFVPNPVLLVVVGGVAQSLLLPALGVSAVWLRFRVAPPGLRPGHLWTVCLFASVAGLLLAGAVGGYQAVTKLLG